MWVCFLFIYRATCPVSVSGSVVEVQNIWRTSGCLLMSHIQHMLSNKFCYVLEKNDLNKVWTTSFLFITVCNRYCENLAAITPLTHLLSPIISYLPINTTVCKIFFLFVSYGNARKSHFFAHSISCALILFHAEVIIW